MMILMPTTDQIRLVTSAAGTINVHVSWADYAPAGSPQITLNRLNTVISTAATTTIIGSPATGTTRTAKSIKISNDHLTVSNTVTLQHYDGTNAIPLENVTLAPGERLGYEEGVGIRVYDALGREKVNSVGLSASGNSNTADVVANAADTYLAGSSLVIGPRVAVGASFHWTLRATKTAAGVAAPVFNVRLGTAGSTADTAQCVHTGVAQTAVVDTGWFELEGNLQAIGSVAVLNTILRMDHVAADAAGMGTFRYVQVKSATFSLPAAGIIGLSCNPGASGVWTFQFVKIASDGLTS